MHEHRGSLGNNTLALSNDPSIAQVLVTYDVQISL